MRQLLHLQHHRHTGKLLHHEHTSYRALAAIFVVSGFFIVSLNMASRAAADQFGVSAMVMAPVPTNPPIISSPTDASILQNGNTLVTGSCPLVTPQVVVSINIDGSQVGTAACDSSNDFSLPVDIASGSHKITASCITISRQQGPVSNPVTVNTLLSSPLPSITITAAQPFIYANSKDVSWTGTVTANAQGPVHAHVDWGDGSTSEYTIEPGTERFTHHYATLASHNILIDAAGANGSNVFEQYGAIAYTAYTSTAPATVQQQHPPFFETSTVVGLYGLYLTALSVMGIVWLEAKHASRQHSTA